MDLLQGEWNFINTTVAPPSTGQIRLNETSQTIASRIMVNKSTPTGIDASNLLASIVIDQEIYMQDKDDATKWQAYVVSGLPINNTTYVDLPVTWMRGGLTLPEQRIILVVRSTDAVVAGDYTFPSNAQLGLTKRQHYACVVLGGLMANPTAYNMPGSGIISLCFSTADRMIEYEVREAAGEIPPIAGAPRKIIS